MKQSIFIGSSVESLNFAKAIQIDLERELYVTIWTQDIFNLTSTSLDDLIVATTKADFAIFIFSPEDLTKIRGKEYQTVRDNVIFELGLFVGKFGDKRKVFIMKPRSIKDMHIPSDLAGITMGDYDDSRADGNDQAIVSPFCAKVLKQINAYRNNGMLSLNGKWSERWWMLDKDDSQIYFEDNDVNVEQFENKVKAQFKFSGRTYLFEGIVEQMRFITGSWRDIENGPTYSGAFQLIINVNANTLYGRWIGFSGSNHEINHGIWEWKREDVEKYPSENR